MPLKADDLHSFEAYKKAMKTAVGQIGKNTPFCIYSDVQLPDASKKMRVVKPFVVVGSHVAQIAPWLKTLPGTKTFSASGTCCLQNGRICLEPDKGKVNYGHIKTQGSLLKEVFGKEILASTKGAGGHEDEDEAPARAPEAAAATTAPPAPPALAPASKPPAPAATTTSTSPVAPTAIRPPIAPAATTTSTPPVAPTASRPTVPPAAVTPSRPPAPPAGATASRPPISPGALPPRPEPHPVRLAKASTAWHGTRGIIDGKCKELKQAIRSHFGNSHPEVLRQIEANLHKIDVVVHNLDHRLAVSMQKASQAATEAARAVELRAAAGILNEYINYVKGSALIAHIDENPFGVQCNLRQVLASSLTHMKQSLIA